MCRSKSSRRAGSEGGAGRVTRNLIVVGCEGRRIGRSPSVLIVHRSTPHVTRTGAAEAAKLRGGLDAQAASSAATVTRATAAAKRRRRAVTFGAYATRDGAPTSQ